MGAPITWRNVDAPNPGLASQPMQAASNSINNSFDIFSKIIQQRQAVDTANMAAVDEGAKQAYLDRLQGFKTPEELAAFEASGAGEQARQALTSVMRGQVRPALEARSASLVNTQRGTEEFGWKKAGAGFAVDANARAQQAAQQAADLAPLTRAAIEAQIAAATQQVATGVQGVKRSEQEIRESAQRVDASKLDQDRLAREQALKEFERRSTAYAGTVAKLGANSQGVVGTPDGMKALTESLTKVIKDPQGLTDAISFVTTALNSNPDFARLPTDVVESLVLAKADEYGRTFGSWDSTLISHMTNGMTAALKTSAPRMLAHEAQRAALTEMAQRQRILVGDAESLAYPEAVARMHEIADAQAAKEKAAVTTTLATAIPAPTPVVAKPVQLPVVDAMAQQFSQESTALNRGSRVDFSPEVKQYLLQKKQDEAAATERVWAQAREKERLRALGKSRSQLDGLR